RDRDRRGKKPKIPSFESKSYEPRQDDRSYSSSLEALPGESLAKLSRRFEPEAEPQTQSQPLTEVDLEDKNASLGAVAEEPPPPRVESKPEDSAPKDSVPEDSVLEEDTPEEDTPA